MKKNKPLVKLNNAGVYRDEKWLVKGVSLEINKQEIVTLIGPNGSGKTTTGKLILDILQPDEGSVSLNTKQISYVPQKINIEKMKDASEFFLGKNDLNAFRSVDCQAKSSVRTVDEIKIKPLAPSFSFL